MENSIFKETMAEMNWLEIEEKAKEGVPILLPLAVIEEHGPHLPLSTDVYFSYTVCRKVRDAIRKLGMDALIAPPYYWGINHCTGGFPGSFSVRPETFKMILFDIFKNLKDFGFNKLNNGQKVDRNLER